jgi:hypothetical protein
MMSKGLTWSALIRSKGLTWAAFRGCQMDLSRWQPSSPLACHPSADDDSEASASSEGTESDEEARPVSPGRGGRRLSSGAGEANELAVFYASNFNPTYMTFSIDGLSWTPPPGQVMAPRCTYSRFTSPALSANNNPHFREFAAIFYHNVRGALSPPHTSSAPGFAAQDHARVQDSNAAQGDTQDMEATLVNLKGMECHGCSEARRPSRPASRIQSPGAIVTLQPWIQLTGGCARCQVACLVKQGL